jgi:secreted trypsin-like serine protease
MNSGKQFVALIRVAIVTCITMLALPAVAIVGGARQFGTPSGSIVMILGVRGNDSILCTGTAIARDLVLTAAHCVAPGTALQIMLSATSKMAPIGVVAQHPRYDARSYARGRVTADVALIKLASPLPDSVTSAALATADQAVAAGDAVRIAGFGVTVQGKNSSTGVAHVGTLVVTGRPGNLQFRLVDPATRGERMGLGACIGDSGGPAFREVDGRIYVLGVISWSTGPAEEEGCGGITGVTPLTLYRPWIVEQSNRFGSSLL